MSDESYTEYSEDYLEEQPAEEVVVPQDDGPRLDPNQSYSLMSVDVGAVNTRAVLFDAVEGRYRFLAAGSSPTTANAPMYDASEGVRFAIDGLERISGRALTTEGSELILPTTREGDGVDHLAATLSGVPPLKVVVAGLLEEVSLGSAQNLVRSTYTEVVASLGLNDRNIQKQINAVLKAQPDLIVLAGGTDNGASQSILRLVNALGMAIHMMPEGKRPSVLYAGNHAIADKINEFLSQMTYVQIAPNIRPALDFEQLGPAEAHLADIFRQFYSRKIRGFDELNAWSNRNLQPTSTSFGRVIRFLSEVVPGEGKGVLGVDIGAASSAVAAAFDGELRLRVFTETGVGTGLTQVLATRQLEDIIRWVPIPVKPAYVLDYIQNKIVNPGTLPATREDMAIEQALARELMAYVVNEAKVRWPRNVNQIGTTLPMFNPIMVRGAAVVEAPTLAQSLLMILDGIQPTGIQQIIIDRNHLAPALGAAAAVNPLMVAQMLFDPVAFTNLGYVIAPVVSAHPGSQVMRVRVKYDTGHENVIDAHMGEIQLIPLPTGRRARLYIDPLQRADIGNGPGRSITMDSITGGPFGVVIDARGRPLEIPENNEERLKTLQKWHLSFGR